MINALERNALSKKQTPVFSFYSLFDLDIGLMNLIEKEYLNKKVFDAEFFKLPNLKKIKILYERRKINPLTSFSLIDDYNLLDSYYEEFKQKKYMDMFNMSVSTGIFKLVMYIKSTNEFTPKILYYEDWQKEVLSNDSNFENIDLISLDALLKDKNTFNQIYVKYIEELYPFSDYNAKSFYLSSFGCNMNEEREDFIDDKIIITLLENRNYIFIYDMYDYSILNQGE